MQNFRQILRWTALAGLTCLYVLSILGALLGVERACAFFNSVPMGVCWTALMLLLAAGVAFFPAMVRRPGLGLMHLGCVLVLAGGLWGSRTAHDLRAPPRPADDDPDHPYTGKVYKGYMRVPQGHAANQITDEHGHLLTTLDFSVKLRRFWIDYYKPPRERPWPILLATATGRTDADRYLTQPVEWKTGRDTLLPGTDIRMTVESTSESSLYNPSWAPATRPSGHPLMPNFNPDAGVPAFQLTLRRGTISQRLLWETRAMMFAQQGWDALSLRMLFADGPDGEAQWTRMGSPMLAVMAADRDHPGLVKHYKADLAVLDADGDEVPGTREVIEVNRPLHYGGYSFCQADWDKGAWRYTVLSVTSDTGMTAVWAGFLTLGAGTVFHFWVAPLLRGLRRKQP